MITGKAALVVLVAVVLMQPLLAEEPVDFDDANLKIAIENELGVFDPTPTDMLSLTSLDVEKGGITSLSGLEYALNLRELCVSHNLVIDDISPLEDLTRLRRLSIDNNSIESLSPLNNLCNLSYLNCHENDISNIGSISELTDLETLIIRHNPLDGLGGLDELTNLYHLDLMGTGIQDITEIASLTYLETLWLSENEISDVSPLAQLMSLDFLYLEHNQVCDMGPLMGIAARLTVLDLSDNPLDSVAYMDHVPRIAAQYPGLLFRYDLGFTHSLSISSTAGGSVIEPGEGLFDYDHEQLVNLKASSEPPYTFTGWSGDQTADVPEITLSLVADTQIKAHFSSRLDFLYVDGNWARDSDLRQDGTYDRPFDSIQKAIDVAKTGATVIVRSGRYVENIDFLGKAITVTGFDPNRSEMPRGYPVIDGSAQAQQVVTFAQGEGLDTRLLGFVITGGYGKEAGGILCHHSSPALEHCLVVGNRAQSDSGKGGAVCCIDSHAVFINCTMHGNYGGYEGAGFYHSDSEAVILNSILSGNSLSEVLVLGDGSPILSYCAIAGGCRYLGEQCNTSRGIVPRFKRPGEWEHAVYPGRIVLPEDYYARWVDGDYHLISEAGRWDADSLRWGIDPVSSPCIDTGDPSMPVGDEPGPHGDVINTGAYGGTLHASKSIP